MNIWWVPLKVIKERGMGAWPLWWPRSSKTMEQQNPMTINQKPILVIRLLKVKASSNIGMIIKTQNLLSSGNHNFQCFTLGIIKVDKAHIIVHMKENKDLPGVIAQPTKKSLISPSTRNCCFFRPYHICYCSTTITTMFTISIHI